MRPLTFFLRVVILVVLLAGAACGGDKSPVRVPAAKASKPCPNKLPFTAAYLPAGFTNSLADGPASGRPTLKNVAIFHYTGSGGRYIEILRGGKRAPLTGSVGMIVLSHLARIGPIAQGYAINFRLASQRCGTFQIVSNIKNDKGAELVKVGHGLKAAPQSS